MKKRSRTLNKVLPQGGIDAGKIREKRGPWGKGKEGENFPFKREEKRARPSVLGGVPP